MLSAPFFIAVSALAQAVGADTFFQENEEAIVYTYSPEMEKQGLISKVPVATSFATFVEYQKAAYAEDRRAALNWKAGRVFMGRERFTLPGDPGRRHGGWPHRPKFARDPASEGSARNRQRLDRGEIPAQVLTDQGGTAGTVHGREQGHPTPSGPGVSGTG